MRNLSAERNLCLALKRKITDLIVSKMPGHLTVLLDRLERMWHRFVYLRVKLKMTEEIITTSLGAYHLMLVTLGVSLTSELESMTYKTHPGWLPETLDMSKDVSQHPPSQAGLASYCFKRFVKVSVLLTVGEHLEAVLEVDYAQILDKCSAWGARYQTDQLERRSKHGRLLGSK